MTDFQQLESRWNKQKNIEIPKNGALKVIDQTENIRNKQKITKIVLALTVIILVGFFIYISAINNLEVTLALGLMIASVIIRIILEILSLNQLKRLQFQNNLRTFKAEIKHYYKRRIVTHYILTPIIILAYCIGFVLLLPYFEKNLSSGFYIYIKISSVIIFITLSSFFAHHIKREINGLKNIISDVLV